MNLFILGILLALAASAQTVVNGGRTYLGPQDASGATSTKPVKSGTAPPGTCSVPEMYFETDATAGQNLWLCTATNTWTQVTSGTSAFSGLSSGTNTTAAMVIGSGSSLTFTGTGSINASNVGGISGFGYGSRQADGTWTTRAFTGTANEISISDGGGLTGNTNIGLASTVNLSSKTVRVPNSTSLPGTCTVGDAYMDTDATSGARWHLCEATNTWVAQGGSGSGVSAFSDLTGLMRVTATTSVISVAAGSIVYRDSASGVLVPQSISAATLTRTGSAESGTIRMEVDDNGGSPIIRCLVSTSLTLSNHTASGCTKVAQNAFSEGAIPLATIAVASGDYSTTPTDLRTPFAFWKYSNGTGLLLNGTVLSVNSAVVGLMANANTWAAKQTFTPTASAAGAQVVCAALPSTPVNGDLVCDSGDSNRVKVRSNGAWVTIGSGGGGVKRGTYASRPTCDASLTDVSYKLTDIDAVLDFQCNGTSWQAYYLGSMPVTEVPSSGWTSVNSPTVSAALGTYKITGGTSNVYASVLRAVPGSTPYKITACLTANIKDSTGANGYPGFSLMATNGTGATDDIVALSTYTNGEVFQVQTLTATDLSFGGLSATQRYQLITTQGLHCLQYEDNGTTRYWRMGPNKTNLNLVHSESRTTFLTATHIGVNVSDATSGMAQSVHLVDWTVE